MRLDQFIIAIAMFSLFIVGGTLIMADINTNYGTNLNTSDFGDVYDTIDETYDLGQGMKNSTIGAEITTDNAFDSAVGGSYSAVRQTSGTFVLIGEILGAIASKLGIPQFVVTFTLIVISISAIFAIIYLFMRFQPR